jgi:hypothetical protein
MWPAQSFSFICSRQWQELTATDDSLTRLCADCGNTVHFCLTTRQIRENAKKSRCISVQHRSGRMLVGQPSRANVGRLARFLDRLMDGAS